MNAVREEIFIRDSGLGVSAAVPAGVSIGWRHVLAPTLVGVVCMLWLELAGGNQLIADRLYALEGGRWLLKDHVITSTLIHHGGKYLSMSMWLAVLVAWSLVRARPALAAWQRPLLYLWLATLLATVLVSSLQSLTAIDCPWDMQGYGGLRPYLGLFDARPAAMRDSGCFPAGHASAGYCWVALYFFLGNIAPRWRRHGLAFGLLLGLVFGLSQQLRGAHFASHDVATLLVCWLGALSLQIAMRVRQVARS